MPGESQTNIQKRLVNLSLEGDKTLLDNAIRFLQSFDFRSITRDHLLMNVIRHLISICETKKYSQDYIVDRLYKGEWNGAIIDLQSITAPNIDMEQNIAECIAYNGILKRLKLRNERLEKILIDWKGNDFQMELHDSFPQSNQLEAFGAITDRVTEQMVEIGNLFENVKNFDKSESCNKTDMTGQDLQTLVNGIKSNQKLSEQSLSELLKHEPEPIEMLKSQATRNTSFFSRRFVQDKMLLIQRFLVGLKKSNQVHIIDRSLSLADLRSKDHFELNKGFSQNFKLTDSSKMHLDRVALLIDSQKNLCEDVDHLVNELVLNLDVDKMRKSLKTLSDEIEQNKKLSMKLRAILNEIRTKIK
ncbi:hypothetical protein ACOME3_003800 [Neoechinorhynchus agilis]